MRCAGGDKCIALWPPNPNANHVRRQIFLVADARVETALHDIDQSIIDGEIHAYEWISQGPVNAFVYMPSRLFIVDWSVWKLRSISADLINSV